MYSHLHITYYLQQSWGPILERNQNKSQKSFPPCHSQSPLQLCIEISISSNSRNLLCISLNSHNLLHISTVQLLYTVKEKGGKSDRKPNPLPYGIRNPYRNLKSEYSQDYSQKPQRNCAFMNSASGFKRIFFFIIDKERLLPWSFFMVMRFEA